MEPLTFLRTLRRGWIVIALAGMLGGLIGGLWATSQTPRYRATTTLFFSVTGVDSTSSLLQGSTFTQNQVRSYALLAKMPAVLGPVIEKLDLNMSPNQLATRVTTSIPPDTVLLNVGVESASPQEASDIANEVGTQLAKVVAELSKNGQSTGSGLKAEGTTVAEAPVPKWPFSPNTKKTVLLGLIAGLVVGSAAVLLREVLNTKVRNEDGVRAITEVPVLGSIPHDSSAAKKPVIRPGDHGPRAESLRRLTRNLDFVDLGRELKTVVVTSSIPNEGKSLTATNLAIVLSESMRVILVDADMRNPSVALALGVDGSRGLSTVLSGRAHPRDVVQELMRGQMAFMPAGEVPPNPSQLLASSRMANLLDDLRKAYDVVIIDSPPILPVSDATVLCQQVDGSLVVVNARLTTSSQLTECLRNFSRSGSRALGIVLNEANVAYDSYHYGAYGAKRSAPAEESLNPDPVAPAKPARRAAF